MKVRLVVPLPLSISVIARRLLCVVGICVLWASTASLAQTWSYVDPAATGPGTAGDENDPFPTIGAAFASGVTEARVIPGTYAEDITLGGGIVYALRTWNGMTGVDLDIDVGGTLDLIGNIVLQEGASLGTTTDTLIVRSIELVDGGFQMLLTGPQRLTRILGDLTITKGDFDLRGGTLELVSQAGDTTSVFVGEAGNLIDAAMGKSPHATAAPRSPAEIARRIIREVNPTVRQALVAELKSLRQSAKTSRQLNHGGLLRFIGDSDTEVFVETTAGRLRFDFPAIEIDGDNHVSFDASGGLEFADIIGTPHFTVTRSGGAGDEAPTGRGFELKDGIDFLDVAGNFTITDGEVLMAGLSSVDPVTSEGNRQSIQAGEDIIIENGELFAQSGDASTFGDFFIGPGSGTTPGDALVNLGRNGSSFVDGTFRVGPDTDPLSDDPALRNRIVLDGEFSLTEQGGLFLQGNYSLIGTGDLFDDGLFLENQQGLKGRVFFFGSPTGQSVLHRQDEDAFFNDVSLFSFFDENLVLTTDAIQNATGTLELQQGIIDTNNEQFGWIIRNPNFEKNLVRRNRAEFGRGKGVVQLGSRDSYINGEVERVVEFGNAEGGIITGGYLFPVGEHDEASTNPRRDVDFFRPLILQFPDDLGRSSVARVDYRQDLTESDVDFAPINDGGLHLDIVDDMFWQLEFDPIPSSNPNIRVQADDLPNILDINSLRLMQWDCDGTNPRIPGTYAADPDRNSAVANAFIDGVPNITHEGVDVGTCNLYGIASNSTINPINLPQTGTSPVQLINLYPRDLQIFNLEFPVTTMVSTTATPFIDVPSGSDKFVLFDRERSIARQDVGAYFKLDTPAKILFFFRPGFTGFSSGEGIGSSVQDDARTQAEDPSQVDLSFGYFGDGQADIRAFDADNQLLFTDGFESGDVSSWSSSAPTDGQPVTVDVRDGTTGEPLVAGQVDLSARTGEALTIAAVETFDATPERQFTILIIDAAGNISEAVIVTDVDDEPALPDKFVLLNAFPNPFSETTSVPFLLPRPSDATLTIVDILGRQVRVLSAGSLTAGRHQFDVEAEGLTPGLYMYRLEAGEEVGEGSFVVVR